MRSYNSDDEYDLKTAKELNAPKWMLDLLSLNPAYVSWGPGEDYMSENSIETWKDLAVTLNDLNECVNWYFQIVKRSEECQQCEGSGYNSATKKLADDYYDFTFGPGSGWRHNLTEDEIDALIKNKRSTTEHDAINRFILIETRAKRLGIWGHCSTCNGSGSLFTESECHLSVVLWFLKPRKGGSWGLTVNYIERSDLSAVQDFLREAAKRNAERFSKVLNQCFSHDDCNVNLEMGNQCIKSGAEH